MKKIIFIAFIVTSFTVMGYNIYTGQRLNALSDIALANIEALAQDEIESDKTWQVGEKTITTSSPGWTYNATLDVWLFEGKVTATQPPEIEVLKIKCCRAKGPLDSCSYEEC